MANEIVWLKHAKVGDRVMSKATRVLGCIDRILQNGNLVIITDSGQTVCDCPGHIEILAKPKVTVKDIFFLRSLRIATLCFVLMSSFLAKKLDSRPSQPDAKRVHEIAAALVAQHFAASDTMTWPQVQEACRSIAAQRSWQTHYAPDARVLILLELGNPNSDSGILNQKLLHPELDE